MLYASKYSRNETSVVVRAVPKKAFNDNECPLSTDRTAYFYLKQALNLTDTKCIRSLCFGGGRVERRCWVNFQCRGVLLVWVIVGQGPIALAVGAGGGCLDIFSLIYLFSFLLPLFGRWPDID